MKPIEEFLSDQARRKNSPSATFTSDQCSRRSALPDGVRQAASRGWQVFPVSPLAKLRKYWSFPVLPSFQTYTVQNSSVVGTHLIGTSGTMGFSHSAR